MLYVVLAQYLLFLFALLFPIFWDEQECIFRVIRENRVQNYIMSSLVRRCLMYAVNFFAHGKQETKNDCSKTPGALLCFAKKLAYLPTHVQKCRMERRGENTNKCTFPHPLVWEKGRSVLASVFGERMDQYAPL